MQNKIQLSLELPQVNQILAALGKLPYEEVYDLVETIKQQAHSQLDGPSNQNGPLEDRIETTGKKR